VSDVSQERGSDEPHPPVNLKSSKEAAPESDAYVKKCPACGKFTRDANVCRHCGHDLTPPQPNAKAKANFSPGERKVATLVSILAALTVVGARTGLLPPFAIIVAIFALPVTGGVLCMVVSLRAQREGMAGGVKFGIYGIVIVTLLTIVAMQLFSGA
jgi:rRNA maturation protein Nop10